MAVQQTSDYTENAIANLNRLSHLLAHAVLLTVIKPCLLIAYYEPPTENIKACARVELFNWETTDFAGAMSPHVSENLAQGISWKQIKPTLNS